MYTYNSYALTYDSLQSQKQILATQLLDCLIYNSLPFVLNRDCDGGNRVYN